MESTSATTPAFFKSEWFLSKNPHLDKFLDVINILIFGVVVFGNSLTIVSVWKFEYLKSNINTLIMALSCADLFVGVMSFVFNITLFYDFYGNDVTAFYYIYSLLSTGYMASVSHLAAIAIDRVIAVLYPLQYHVRMTQGKIKALIAIAWVVPILFGITPLPALVVLNGFWTIYPYIDYINAIFYFLVGIFIVVAYVSIIPAVYHQARHMSLQSVDESRIIRREIKATITLGIVVIVYLLCWLPFFIYCLVYWIIGTPMYYWTIVLILSTSNSGVNFVVYALRSKDFRGAYLHLLSCGRKSRRVADFSTST